MKSVRVSKNRLSAWNVINELIFLSVTQTTRALSFDSMSALFAGHQTMSTLLSNSVAFRLAEWNSGSFHVSKLVGARAFECSTKLRGRVDYKRSKEIILVLREGQKAGKCEKQNLFIEHTSGKAVNDMKNGKWRQMCSGGHTFLCDKLVTFSTQFCMNMYENCCCLHTLTHIHVVDS